MLRPLAGLGAGPLAGKEVVLALDGTTLGDRFVVLACSVVYRGCALPVAWTVLRAGNRRAWRREWLRLLRLVRPGLPAPVKTVLVLADRGFYACWLFGRIVRLGWCPARGLPLLRINAGGKLRLAGHAHCQLLRSFAPHPGAQRRGRGVAFVTKSRRLPCTLLVTWEAGCKNPWLLLTDLAPEVADASWYGRRAWIEQGFKSTKRAGWQWQRTRAYVQMVIWLGSIMDAKSRRPHRRAMGAALAVADPCGAPPQQPKTGRPAEDHRRILNGILWRIRTGAPWRDVPERYGPWSTLASRLRRWRRVERGAEQQALGRSRGGYSTKVHLRAEGAGKLLTVVLTPGQAHEAPVFEQLLDGTAVRRRGRGRPRQRPKRIVGGKGSSSRTLRRTCRHRGVRCTIPHRSNEHRTGPFDWATYRTRNVVERLIALQAVPRPRHPLREAGRHLPHPLGHCRYYPLALGRSLQMGPSRRSEHVADHVEDGVGVRA